MKIDLTGLVTESRNNASAKIDTLTTFEMLSVINAEDQKVALAVRAELQNITLAVDAVTHAFSSGGRLSIWGRARPGVWVFWMPVSALPLTVANTARFLSAV